MILARDARQPHRPAATRVRRRLRQRRDRRRAVPDVQRRRRVASWSGSACWSLYLTVRRSAGRDPTEPASDDRSSPERTVEGPAPAGRVDLAVAVRRRHQPGPRPAAHRRRTRAGRRRDGAGRATGSRGGERISVELSAPPDETLEPESIPLVVAYEDDTMLIVDKPAGLVVHPSAGHPTRDARQRAPRSGARSRRAPRVDRRRRPTRDRPSARQGDERPDRGRQDRCGPGQPSCASSATAASRRSTSPSSAASPPASRGRVEAPIGRDPRDRQRMAVVAGGRESVTEYEQLADDGGYALLALRPAHRPHAPDPRAPRVPGAADRRRHALRRRGGPGRPAAPVPARVSARARCARRTDARLRAWSELPPDLAASLPRASATACAVPPTGPCCRTASAPRWTT